MGWAVRVSNPDGDEIFPTRPDRPWGPTSPLSNGYRLCFPGVKWLGRGVDNPPPHLAPKLKKEYSSVDLATGYGLVGKRIKSRWGRDFPHSSRQALGTNQPSVHWVPGLFPGVKWLGRGVDNPPPHLAPS
jgi:hypothetical protein